MSQAFYQRVIKTGEKIQYIGAGSYYFDKNKNRWTFTINRRRKSVRYFSHGDIEVVFERSKEI